MLLQKVVNALSVKSITGLSYLIYTEDSSSVMYSLLFFLSLPGKVKKLDEFSEREREMLDYLLLLTYSAIQMKIRTCTILKISATMKLTFKAYLIIEFIFRMSIGL